MYEIIDSDIIVIMFVEGFVYFWGMVFLLNGDLLVMECEGGI